VRMTNLQLFSCFHETIKTVETRLQTEGAEDFIQELKENQLNVLAIRIELLSRKC
jgi:hypothetical protein